MSVRPSMFLTSSTSSVGAISGEIDLRAEFDKLIYGPNGDGYDRHSYPIIIRRLRRDTDGYPTYCECATDSDYKQGNKHCQYCFGEGYLWDEEWALTYSMFVGPDGGQANRFIRMPPGNINVDYRLFFLRYDTDIKHGDKIVEVVVDADGEVTTGSDGSYIRESIYKPQTINKQRSDNGRIEFFAIYCREEDAIRNNNPQ